MRRREFITLVVAFPLAAQAERAGRLPIIGLLGPNIEGVDRPRVAAFVHRLDELNWVEGRSIIIDYRSAEGVVERAAGILADFVRRPVDIIVVAGDAQVLAAKRATATIPIVMSAAGNPVGNGLVASLARPGGNVTGLSLQLTDTAGKRLELLREIVPRLQRLAIMANFANPTTAVEVDFVEAATHKLGLDTIRSQVGSTDDIAPAIERLKGDADALYVCADPLLNTNGARINAAALAARLPSMHSFRNTVEAGALVSYGPDFPASYRRAAELVDKILHGAKPADIPVEQSDKFDFVINLKTAKILGLEISPSLLARADETIE
ncbi:MAG TPA: ABC transporter substrate-binding protein [Pirellulaceae bacterium]|jgi:putative ABC transport system substrate-binding protein